jgi:hypothetical protein
MRPLPLILLLASCAALHAQDQERKLVDRILQPDMSLGNPMQNKAFSGGGGTGGMDTSRNAYVKDFDFVQKFSPKAYDARQYEAKNYWQGDFQFATKTAAVKADPATGKSYDTKTLPVKDAREAGKAYETATRAYATREAQERGKSQNRLDEQYKDKPQLNIDQVRDLLNKPKL